VEHHFLSGPVWRSSASLVSLILCLEAATAFGAIGDEADEAAISLADQAPKSVQAAASGWKIVGELDAGMSSFAQSTPGPYSWENFERESLSLRYQGNLSERWSAVFANRVDSFQFSAGGGATVNSLQEAYLGLRASDEASVRVGRVNLRNGVGIGYNPTDYFRTDAIRSQVSFVPSVQREGRQGSVMLDGQQLTDYGAFNLEFSPDLSPNRPARSFSPDFASTNNKSRWLASAGLSLGSNVRPQLLVFQQAGQPVQAGLNLTMVPTGAIVLYLEASAGRKADLFDTALDRTAGDSFYAQVASGLTYTLPSNLSLTLEYEQDGSSLDGAGWRRLVAAPVAQQIAFANYVTNSQELPTRRAAFMYASWKDFGIARFNLSAYVRREFVTGSGQYFAEARYHWDHVDLAFQYLRNGGPSSSVFGSMPTHQSGQILLDYYP
jgi:hypothetical protein